MLSHQPDTLQFILSLIVSIVFAFISASVAERKGRNTTTWFIMGVLFSFFALIVLLFLPSLKKEEGPMAPKTPVPDVLSQFPPRSEEEDKLWFYLDVDHQQMGPVSVVALRELWNTGLLELNSFVWSEGMDKWEKVESLQKLREALNRPV